MCESVFFGHIEGSSPDQIYLISLRILSILSVIVKSGTEVLPVLHKFHKSAPDNI